MDDALLGLLKIEPADIEANRAGRLGASQRRNRRRHGRNAVIFWALLGVALIAGGVVSSANGGQWFVPVLLGVIVLAAGTATRVGERRGADDSVRRLTGPVQLVVVSMGRAGTSLKLVVGGERCGIPQSLKSTRKNWQAALGDRPYHVYVNGKEPAVVGIEPASA